MEGKKKLKPLENTKLNNESRSYDPRSECSKLEKGNRNCKNKNMHESQILICQKKNGR